MHCGMMCALSEALLHCAKPVLAGLMNVLAGLAASSVERIVVEIDCLRDAIRTVLARNGSDSDSATISTIPSPPQLQTPSSRRPGKPPPPPPPPGPTRGKTFKLVSGVCIANHRTTLFDMT
jgi:hypothetical protein